MQQVAGDVAHVGPVIEGQDPPVPEHAALVRQRPEVERDLHPAGRQDPAERAADLKRLDRAPVTEPAGEPLAQLGDRHPEGHLVDARAGEALVEADELRARGAHRG